MIKYLLLTLLLFGYYYSFPQLSLQKDFTAQAGPTPGSEEWLSLNHASKNEFKVSMVRGQLVIARAKIFQTQLSIQGGKLLGIDDGEWEALIIYS